ncbi:hypothetical protein ASF61_06270 [Duganella sp. Leaf126]|uniref:DUF4272 domain-containing protein n=1 Tax=Duganella sp. Leaf126 TaxID=1736266 RepID=UPI0006F393FD|nr:DUF4272 domain-containing protein [Duganella sp. Leaf126]KQQ40367.1 hypothetical protein ASF61_06270 [Duganella sp. Leaf126]
MFKRLKQLLSPAMPSVPQGDQILVNAYATVAELPPRDFPHTTGAARSLADPALAPHLNGFMHHVADAGNGQMTRTRYHVIRHIQRVQQHVSLAVAPADMPGLLAWMEMANAIAFMPDGSVLDPHGRALLNAGGADGEPQAAVPYPPAAWARKARTDALLAQRQIAVPADLPPVVSDPELRLRTPEEVLRRMLALFAVTIRAESLTGEQPIAVADLQQRFPPAFAGLTERERDFLAKDAPPADEVTQFLWRYEAILELQWALGLQEALPFPDAICDVAAISSTVIERATDGLRKQPVMRSGAEVLDALDLHYRLHWASRQALLKKTAVPAGLNDSVLQERHHALNWLVRFEDRDWDDVDTPT